MSRNAKTFGESWSLKDGISPSRNVSAGVHLVTVVERRPLMILQNIHEAILDIGVRILQTLKTRARKNESKLLLLRSHD